MERILRRLTLVAAVLMGVAATATAQSTVCRAANDSSYDMIEMIKTYALATDSAQMAVRDSLGIPAVASASDIQLVTRESTCKSAKNAYQGAATGAQQTLSGRVYVVQVGTTAYVVWDPQYRYAPATPLDVYMVFTSRWVKKSVF